ncbi:hypothetical protein BELL_0579g00030 [Botrytis elliptica]|uniref:Heme haloperoxidase family profile domain-containing protein n=1 Tax=Botrytis elliptica TaxID=278938 RepID=A0A4Z1JJE6_9HELO|nr:hypothetical protein EAE99_004997 [Botrytis elliptica]TGO71412.1 hypothetical protein BELL_0579g00030 [Botrytis elliptica]
MFGKIIFLAAALPVFLANAQGSFTNWSPPGPGDVRSPCPAMNSLANHGFLPHDGKGITVPDVITALDAALNVGVDFATAIGTAGLLSVQGNLFATSFNLDDLNEHNFPIEHDGSLSRADYYSSPNHDDYSFNQTIFKQFLSFFTSPQTSISVAAAAKYARVKYEEEHDPHFSYSAQHFVLSYGETALYLSTLGDPVEGIADVEWVRVFFEEERLPYREGWRRGSVQTNLASLAVMIERLMLANEEVLPEGLEVTAQTVGIAFGGYDPLTGVLGHVVG